VNAVDTSVVVAAFAPWHESHAVARSSVGRSSRLPAHCAMESYATLTSLPEPFRVEPAVAAEYLTRQFGDRHLILPPEALHSLPGRLAALGIKGGASYDALVAVTADAAGVRLLSLDRRAERTYRALGIAYDIIA
jgi:predicted nucleic acid-binding protein